MPEAAGIRMLIVDDQPGTSNLCAPIGHSLGLVAVYGGRTDERLRDN